MLSEKLSPFKDFEEYFQEDIVDYTEYHKGEKCPYIKDTLCQEGHCNRCWIRKNLDNG